MNYIFLTLFAAQFVSGVNEHTLIGDLGKSGEPLIEYTPVSRTCDAYYVDIQLFKGDRNITNLKLVERIEKRKRGYAGCYCRYGNKSVLEHAFVIRIDENGAVFAKNLKDEDENKKYFDCVTSLMARTRQIPIPRQRKFQITIANRILP